MIDVYIPITDTQRYKLTGSYGNYVIVQQELRDVKDHRTKEVTNKWAPTSMLRGEAAAYVPTLQQALCMMAQSYTMGQPDKPWDTLEEMTVKEQQLIVALERVAQQLTEAEKANK
jgi:hypothetical protein